MVGTGKLQTLWWEIKRRTTSRNIKAACLTINRSQWWDRKGWEDVKMVWIFSTNRDFVNDHHNDLTDVYKEMDRLHTSFNEIFSQLQEINRLGHNVQLVLKKHPRFFFIGAESDEWLVHYRLMFGESTVFDANLSQVDIRV